MIPMESSTRPDQSLASGAAGIALLHAELAHSGVGAWATVRQWAVVMTRSPIIAHPDVCGLYFGAPAVAFALHTASPLAHRAALETLNGHVAAVTRRRLEQAHHRIDRGLPPLLREFDLIRGLTGLGVYLLHRGDPLLRGILSYLVRLTRPMTVDGQVLPGWWARHDPRDRPSPDWPGGHGNLGMAHGIAGPLALLSAAMRCGVTVPGHADAIDRICTWLDQCRSGSRAAPWWPGVISLPEWQDRTIRQPGPQRPSWCYGTPGLSRAQQLAGLALGDATRRRLAERALYRCVTDERQLSQLIDASLCHGWAGLIQATWRTAADASDDALTAELPRLLTCMNEHLTRHGPPAGKGLLEGRAGIRLVQHRLAHGGSSPCRWDACLLLDGGPCTERTR